MVLEEKPLLKVKIAQSFRVTAEMLSGTSVTLSRVKAKDPARLLSYQVHAPATSHKRMRARAQLHSPTYLWFLQGKKVQNPGV